MKLYDLLQSAATLTMLCSIVTLRSEGSGYRLDLHESTDEDDVWGIQVEIRKIGSDFLDEMLDGFWFKRNADRYSALDKYGISLDDESWEFPTSQRVCIMERAEAINDAVSNIGLG